MLGPALQHDAGVTSQVRRETARGEHRPSRQAGLDEHPFFQQVVLQLRRADIDFGPFYYALDPDGRVHRTG